MGKMYPVSKNDKPPHTCFVFLLSGNWANRNYLGLLDVKVLAAVLVFVTKKESKQAQGKKTLKPIKLSFIIYQRYEGPE